MGKAEGSVSTRARRATTVSGACARVGPGRTAPGPRGAGSIPASLRAFQKNAPQLFAELRREYGDMVRLPLGFFTVHLNYEPEAIQYVLQDNNRNYVRGKGYDAFRIFMGTGLLTTDGDEWRNRRRIVNPLFHRTAVTTMTTTMTDTTTRVLDDWERRASAVGKQGLDVVPEMMDLALGALGQIMFDTDLAADLPQVGPAMVTAIEAMVFRGTLPQLTPSFVPIPYNLRIRRARKVLHRVVGRIVAAHREGLHGELTDLVSLLMSAKDADTGAELSEAYVRDEIVTVFMAGHETTGTGLSWALFELARNPEIQRELQAEVDRVLGGRAPTMADLPELPYARMVVDETLRLHPPIWVYPRDAVQEDVVGGYRIPAKSSVFLVPYVTHRHPDYWLDPESFDPQRFSADQEAKRPRYAYFPFGGGQRKCIGNSMALLQMQLTIAMIAQRFTLGVPWDFVPDLGTLVSLRPSSGIRLTIEGRP